MPQMGDGFIFINNYNKYGNVIQFNLCLKCN